MSALLLQLYNIWKDFGSLYGQSSMDNSFQNPLSFESIQKALEMPKEIESYNLGNVKVVITETGDPKKLNVDCNDGNYHSEFKVSRYEFKNYKRHMNQKITKAYKRQYEEG